MAAFAHLRVRSAYTPEGGILTPEALCEVAAQTGAEAVTWTDPMGLGPYVALARAAETRGLRPLVGCDLLIAAGRELQRVTALCADERGYRDLLALLASAEIKDGRRQPLPWERLRRFDSHGVHLLWGEDSAFSVPVQTGDVAAAKRVLASLRPSLRRRSWLAVCAYGGPTAVRYAEAAPEAAKALGLGLVAHNEVRYAHQGDAWIYRIRRLIARDWATLHPHDIAGRWHCPPETCAAALPEEALSGLADLLSRLSPIRHRVLCPVYPGGDPALSQDDLLRNAAERGLERRLRTIPHALHPRYRERLREELAVIAALRFAGYFVVVADVLREARRLGIPTGPGRGSAVASLVAYALHITDVDPIRHDLPFGRFLHDGRETPPDIDIDLGCEDVAPLVDYLRGRHGTHRVGILSAWATFGPKHAIRETARVLHTPPEVLQHVLAAIGDGKPSLARLLDPASPTHSTTLAKIAASSPDAARLLEAAASLESLPRHLGTHPSGILVAPTSLAKIAPVIPDRGTLRVELTADELDAAGIAKIDLLRLRTLAQMQRCLDAAHALGIEAPRRIRDIPIADGRALDLLRHGMTAGVFQAESTGMRRMLMAVAPRDIEEVMAAIALFRPGPLRAGMDALYLGERKPELPQALRALLAPTRGVLLYQEQLMAIATHIAGWTPAEADRYRRTVISGTHDERQALRERFVADAQRRGLQPEEAAAVYDFAASSSGYVFARAHAAAYAHLVMQTAWLHAHLPAAHLVAFADRDARIPALVREARDLGVRFLPPDPNHGAEGFSLVAADTVRWGLAHVRGLSHTTVRAILTARAEGPFGSADDLRKRVPMSEEEWEALRDACVLHCLGLPPAGNRAERILRAYRRLGAIPRRSALDALASALPAMETSRGHVLLLAETTGATTRGILAVRDGRWYDIRLPDGHPPPPVGAPVWVEARPIREERGVHVVSAIRVLDLATALARCRDAPLNGVNGGAM